MNNTIFKDNYNFSKHVSTYHQCNNLMHSCDKCNINNIISNIAKKYYSTPVWQISPDPSTIPAPDELFFNDTE